MNVDFGLFFFARPPVLRFRASLYPCPETPQERKEMAAGVNTRIDDLQMVRGESQYKNNTVPRERRQLLFEVHFNCEIKRMELNLMS